MPFQIPKPEPSSFSTGFEWLDKMLGVNQPIEEQMTGLVNPLSAPGAMLAGTFGKKYSKEQLDKVLKEMYERWVARVHGRGEVPYSESLFNQFGDIPARHQDEFMKEILSNMSTATSPYLSFDPRKSLSEYLPGQSNTYRSSVPERLAAIQAAERFGLGKMPVQIRDPGWPLEPSQSFIEILRNFLAKGRKE